MTLFMFTGVVICHHTYARRVQLELSEMLNASPHDVVAQATPVLFHSHLDYDQAIFDAVLSPDEKLIAILSETVKTFHPKIHRVTGLMFEACTDEKLRKTSEVWLPEIAIAMVTNNEASARSMFDYWSGMPRNARA